MTGGCAESNVHAAAALSWLAHIIPWVLITPLGCPVEPEVNRILPTVSGPTRAKAASTAGVGRNALKAANGVRRLSARLPRLATISNRVAPTAARARA